MMGSNITEAAIGTRSANGNFVRKADFNRDRIELACCLQLKGQLVVKQALRANAPSDYPLIYEQGQGAASTHPTANLPHRTTGHPHRGMSVSVRLDGALHRPCARARRCVGA